MYYIFGWYYIFGCDSALKRFIMYTKMDSPCMQSIRLQKAIVRKFQVNMYMINIYG